MNGLCAALSIESTRIIQDAHVMGMGSAQYNSSSWSPRQEVTCSEWLIGTLGIKVKVEDHLKSLVNPNRRNIPAIHHKQCFQFMLQCNNVQNRAESNTCRILPQYFTPKYCPLGPLIMAHSIGVQQVLHAVYVNYPKWWAARVLQDMSAFCFD